VEAAVRLHVGADHSPEEWVELAEEFGIDTDDVKPVEEDFDGEIDGRVPYWGVTSAEQLLPLDSHSPPLLLHRARELTHAADADLDAAERLILQALEVLPEYTSAWWELVQLRRRRRDPAALQLEAAANCLTSPLVFGHFDRAKCLNWFKRLPHEGSEREADPLCSGASG
jgi:hypothetical protein